MGDMKRQHSLLYDILRDAPENYSINVNEDTLISIECMIEFDERMPWHDLSDERTGTLHYYGHHPVFIDPNLGDGIILVLAEDNSQWTISDE